MKDSTGKKQCNWDINYGSNNVDACVDLLSLKPLRRILAVHGRVKSKIRVISGNQGGRRLRHTFRGDGRRAGVASVDVRRVNFAQYAHSYCDASKCDLRKRTSKKVQHFSK